METTIVYWGLCGDDVKRQWKLLKYLGFSLGISGREDGNY